MERKAENINDAPRSLRAHAKQSIVITGIVVHGNQHGRILGFPTANIHIDPLKTPLEHVASLCEVIFNGKTYPAIGTYLPFKKTYEVHLLNWEGDLYDKEIQVSILETIRENRKFDSQDTLQEQIKKDVEYAKNRRILQYLVKKRSSTLPLEEEETNEVIGI